MLYSGTMLKKSIKPNKTLLSRLAISATLGLSFIIIALFAGMLGYHYFEHLTWVDSFVNAAMILSGMGPVDTLKTSGGKIFAGCYALFSGLAFITIIALILSPILHRFLIRAHLEGISIANKRNPG